MSVSGWFGRDKAGGTGLLWPPHGAVRVAARFSTATVATAKGMVHNMRRRILAAVAAAAVVTGGSIAMTQTPAEAHEGCVLLHVQLILPDGSDLLHFCVI